MFDDSTKKDKKAASKVNLDKLRNKLCKHKGLEQNVVKGYGLDVLATEQRGMPRAS